MSDVTTGDGVVPIRVQVTSSTPVAVGDGAAPIRIEVLAVGAAGPKGDDGAQASALAYVHTQSAPAETWTVNHNLGFRPDVSLTTVGGVEFEADVIHTSLNQVIINILTPLAGQARCS